jgi:cell division protein FtsB
MANRAPGGHRNVTGVKRGARTPLILRSLGRLGVAALALLVFTLIAIQFARVIDENVALASELSATQHEVGELEAHRAWQMRQLRRLQDPQGAIPEIHDRLRLVRPNESIVFVSPMPTASTSPTP